MKRIKFLSIYLLMITLGFGVISCKKVKDSDLQEAAQTALAANPDVANVQVTVTEQVATLTGTVNDEATKASAESTVQGIENIKSIVNNIDVVPPAPDYTQIDADLQSGLTDALKDHKGVVAEVNNGVVTLTGKIRKRDLPKLMEKVSALNPISIDNQLTVR